MGSSLRSPATTTGKRAMSSRRISRIPCSTQASPKWTRGRFPRDCWAAERVSMERSKTAMRVSAHSRRRSSTGELTAAASRGAVTTWAML